MRPDDEFLGKFSLVVSHVRFQRTGSQDSRRLPNLFRPCRSSKPDQMCPSSDATGSFVRQGQRHAYVAVVYRPWNNLAVASGRVFFFKATATRSTGSAGRGRHQSCVRPPNIWFLHTNLWRAVAGIWDGSAHTFSILSFVHNCKCVSSSSDVLR